MSHALIWRTFFLISGFMSVSCLSLICFTFINKTYLLAKTKHLLLFISLTVSSFYEGLKGVMASTQLRGALPLQRPPKYHWSKIHFYSIFVCFHFIQISDYISSQYAPEKDKLAKVETQKPKIFPSSPTMGSQVAIEPANSDLAPPPPLDKG